MTDDERAMRAMLPPDRWAEWIKRRGDLMPESTVDIRSYADRLAACGWAPFTRTFPRALVDDLEVSAAAIALTWIGREADLIGQEVLDGTLIVRDEPAGLRVSILARPRVRLDPDPRIGFEEIYPQVEPRSHGALFGNRPPVPAGRFGLALVIGGVLILVAIILVLAAR